MNGVLHNGVSLQRLIKKLESAHRKHRQQFPPPPTTADDGDGDPIPPTAEVVNPALMFCMPCNDDDAATAAVPSPPTHC